MVGGIFFLASIIAIFIVLRWWIANDGVPDDGKTTGLLAMKPVDPNAPPPSKGPKRWTREGRN